MGGLNSSNFKKINIVNLTKQLSVLNISSHKDSKKIILYFF
jgi:hypothetical protein